MNRRNFIGGLIGIPFLGRAMADIIQKPDPEKIYPGPGFDHFMDKDILDESTNNLMEYLSKKSPSCESKEIRWKLFDKNLPRCRYIGNTQDI